MGKPWTFKQIYEGPGKSLTLAGASAPHGRRRRHPVVSDGIKLRYSRVHYPSDEPTPPTTFVSGTTWEPFTLTGRFSDVDLGPGGMSKAVRDWQAFLADASLVQIIWGDVWAATGILVHFVAGRESEYECTYSMTFEIDGRDEVDGTRRGFVVPPSVTAIAQEFQFEADKIQELPELSHAGALKPDFLESLDDAVSSINGFSASLIKVAGEIDDFEEGTLDQLERLRAGIAQTKTAVNRFRETMDSTNNEAALLYRATDADVQWIATKTSTDVSTTRMLSILDEMDREADLARRGRVISVYVARAADSFESMSTRFYGGPDGAGDIRSANGVRYGELPVSGRSYQIPVRV